MAIESQLNQHEIDLLMESINTGTDSFDVSRVESSLPNVLNKKIKTVRSYISRYFFRLINASSYDEIKEARWAFHYEAFSLWCSKKGISKDDYYILMRKEMKKRNLMYIDTNPPGYKLVRILPLKKN